MVDSVVSEKDECKDEMEELTAEMKKGEEEIERLRKQVEFQAKTRGSVYFRSIYYIPEIILFAFTYAYFVIACSQKR